MGNEPGFLAVVDYSLIAITIFIIIIVLFASKKEVKRNYRRFFLPIGDPDRAVFVPHRCTKCSVKTIMEEGSVDYSIIIPLFKYNENSINRIVDVYEYFSSRLSSNSSETFEIIIVSNAANPLMSRIITFARKKNNIVLFCLNSDIGFGFYCVSGVINCNGKSIFVFDINGRAEISDFELFIEKQASLVLGLYRFRVDNPSNLHLFISFLTELLLSLVGVDALVSQRSHTLLLRREAARILIQELDSISSSYENELIVLSGIHNIDIDCIEHTCASRKDSMKIQSMLVDIGRFISTILHYLF